MLIRVYTPYTPLAVYTEKKQLQIHFLLMTLAFTFIEIIIDKNLASYARFKRRKMYYPNLLVFLLNNIIIILTYYIYIYIYLCNIKLFI